jgi:hypothetical protein
MLALISVLILSGRSDKLWVMLIYCIPAVLAVWLGKTVRDDL